MRTPKSPLRPLADASTSTTFPSERRDVKELCRQTENADVDAKKPRTTAGRREHFDDIPFGETRRQETAPTNRKRRCGRQKVPYDCWPTRALRRHSLRRDATSRNCADKPKTPMRTAGRREYFDDIPFGETRRQETAPTNRKRRCGRQKVPYDRWPTRALRRHSLRRDATSRNSADKPNTPNRTPESRLRPLADASTGTTFSSERRDVKKPRREAENAEQDAKKPPTTAGRREHFDDIPFGETRRQETAPTNRKRRCGRQKVPTTAGRREHFDDIPFGETRRQETAPPSRKLRCGRQKVPYDRWPTRALRLHSLRRDATSRNCADKPKMPMRTPKSPVRPLADASTSTTFPSERRDVKKLRRQTENAEQDAKKPPTTAGRREHFDDIPFGETRRQETAPINRSGPMRTPKNPVRPLADASTSTTFPSERRDVKKLRRQAENADADAKRTPTPASRRWHLDEIHLGVVRRSPKQTLVMYADTQEKLEAATAQLRRQPHQAFVARVEAFLGRQEEWVLLYRANTTTRGHNTNNFSEATIGVLKDIVLSRAEAFDAVALVDAVAMVWEKYFESRILLHGHSCVASHQLYAVPSATRHDGVYEVAADFGACSCPVGKQGAFCKQQALVHETFGGWFPNAPPLTTEDRHRLGKLALGDKCPPWEFCMPFRGEQQYQGEEESPRCTPEAPKGPDNAEATDLLEANDQPEAPQPSTSALAPIAAQDPDQAQRAQAREEVYRRLESRMRRLHAMNEENPAYIELLDALGDRMDRITIGNDAYGFMLTLKAAAGVRQRRGRRIRVQPTSLARRRPGLTRGSKRVPAGRPSGQPSAKRPRKRAHSLQMSIRDNVPSARLH
ncbi:uncharacterized protein ISCGN_008039 [Ixodes scapularis]